METIKVLNDGIIIGDKEYPMESLAGEITELENKFLKKTNNMDFLLDKEKREKIFKEVMEGVRFDD